MPHYLVQAKFEPGNYAKFNCHHLYRLHIQICKEHMKVKQILLIQNFSKNFKTLKKYCTEDGGRLYKKRNLHYIINTEINDYQIPGNNFRWMTLWQIREFLKKKIV